MMSLRTVALVLAALAASPAHAGPLQTAPVECTSGAAAYVAEGVVEAVRETTLAVEVQGRITDIRVRAGARAGAAARGPREAHRRAASRDGRRAGGRDARHVCARAPRERRHAGAAQRARARRGASHRTRCGLRRRRCGPRDTASGAAR